VLVTTGTVTSAKLAEQRRQPGVIHQFVPLDSPRFVGRFLDHWKPNLALFTESDLWPNLIMMSSERRIPLILINGKLSERSFNRWRFAPSMISALLRRFDLCLMSDRLASRSHDRRAAHRDDRRLKLDVPERRPTSTVARSRDAIGARVTSRRLRPMPAGDGADRDAPATARSAAARADCAAASRSRAGDPGVANAGGLSACCARGHDCRAPMTISTWSRNGRARSGYRLAPIVFVGSSLAKPRQNRTRSSRCSRRHPARAACLEFRGNLFGAR
jgi:3-deoxy-D-manno-octulosonic-acid transferase